MVLYIQDKGGDENFLLYGVDVASGAQNATSRRSRRPACSWSAHRRTVKDRILVGLNNRDPRWHDVHRLDLKTGELSRGAAERRLRRLLADDDLTLRMADAAERARRVRLLPRRRTARSRPQPFASRSARGLADHQPAGFTTDGKTLYWIDSRGRNTAALIAQDVDHRRDARHRRRPKADIGRAL